MERKQSFMIPLQSVFSHIHPLLTLRVLKRRLRPWPTVHMAGRQGRFLYFALFFFLSSGVALISSLAFGQPSTPEPAEPDKQILSYEIVQDLQFQSLPKATQSESGEQLPAAPLASLSFRAFGQQFTLSLQPNARLIASLSATQRGKLLSTRQLYRGTLAGMEDSWVRLTQIGDQWSGLIWDGIELYAIESRTIQAASALTEPQTDKPSLIIYRASAVVSPGTCALDPNAQAQHNYSALVKELQTLVPALSAATAQINLSILVDAAFIQNNADPQGRALSLLNAVDGIYSEQLGRS